MSKLSVVLLKSKQFNKNIRYKTFSKYVTQSNLKRKHTFIINDRNLKQIQENLFQGHRGLINISSTEGHKKRMMINSGIQERWEAQLFQSTVVTVSVLNLTFMTSRILSSLRCPQELEVAYSAAATDRHLTHISATEKDALIHQI